MVIRHVRMKPRMMLRIFGMMIASLSFGPATVAAMAPADAVACVPAAALHHGVNESILKAILAVESNNTPSAIRRNRNSSIDVGIAGVNSIHFKELIRHGIAPEALSDPCVSTYVAAWLLRRRIARHGNTWFGVAAYHSETPYFNRRYQILLHNQLIAHGVIRARPLPVPPLKPPQP